MADEQKDSQQPEKPAEQPKPGAPAGEGKAAVPKPPPPPPGAKPAAPAASPKPKGPQQEPWSSPLVDAIKEKFGGEFIKSYSFIGQNQIEVKKDRIAEIMTFLRDNTIVPFNYLVDETAVHWPKDEQFEIVYILYSFAKNEHVRVKALSHATSEARPSARPRSKGTRLASSPMAAPSANQPAASALARSSKLGAIRRANSAAASVIEIAASS